MHIMADLNTPAAAMHSVLEHHVICTLKVCLFSFARDHDVEQLDANGVLEVRPNFNSERNPYRIETSNNDIYEYILEHCSRSIEEEERIKELNLRQGYMNRTPESNSAINRGGNAQSPTHGEPRWYHLHDPSCRSQYANVLERCVA